MKTNRLLLLVPVFIFIVCLSKTNKEKIATDFKQTNSLQLITKDTAVLDSTIAQYNNVVDSLQRSITISDSLNKTITKQIKNIHKQDL